MVLQSWWRSWRCWGAVVKLSTSMHAASWYAAAEICADAHTNPVSILYDTPCTRNYFST